LKNILITGFNGYLARSFCNLNNEKYKFKSFSLLSQKIETIDLKNIDTVLHCAALVHQKVQHSYERYYDINVSYPIKLAKLAKENGVKQFIFISSVAVYGEDVEKIDENTRCNPITPYGKSKFEAEKQLLELNDKNFIVSIIRPPMIYGKNAPGNIDSLVTLVRKIPIIPLGQINNKRSFIYIDNLCYIIDVLITQEKEGIFLASDDNSLSTSVLIELIAKNLDKKIYLIKIPFFESFLKILKPSFHKRLYGSLEIDNTISREKLNLINPYSVEKGIRLMIKGETI